MITSSRQQKGRTRYCSARRDLSPTVLFPAVPCACLPRRWDCCLFFPCSQSIVCCLPSAVSTSASASHFSAGVGPASVPWPVRLARAFTSAQASQLGPGRAARRTRPGPPHRQRPAALVLPAHGTPASIASSRLLPSALRRRPPPSVLLA